MSGDAVRRRAVAVLLQVGAGRALDPALERALSRCADQRDRGLLAELVKGTIQWRARYDLLIAHFARTRPPRDRRVREILRLALHQLIATEGVPDYAAVDSAVRLCRTVVGVRPAGFVNALLRAAQRFLTARSAAPAIAIRSLFPDPQRAPVEFLASYHSLPHWLVARWVARWGTDFATALCEHHNRPAPVTLHVLAPADPAAVLEHPEVASLEPRRGTLDPQAIVLGRRPNRPQLRGLLRDLPEVIVQDEAAQALTTWLGAGLHGPLADLCAAPGGKTFNLAARWSAAEPVVALDRSLSRLLMVRQSATRLARGRKTIERIGRSVVLADGRQPPLRPRIWGAVLVDGPCSGTGVLRRHPDARWRGDARTLVDNGQRLLALARAAADLLRPGGRLMYATCSLEPEENEAVVAALLSARSDLTPEGPEGERYWLPPATGSDGFYAARLRKQG